MDYVLHMSYMTGDIFGITAAMALDNTLRIVFAHGSETEKEYQQNKKFYEACGLWGQVEKYDIRKVDRSATPKGVYADFKKLSSGAASGSAVATNLYNAYPGMKEIHEVTSRVAAAYKEDYKGSIEKVMSTWKLKDAPPEAMTKLRNYTAQFVDDETSQYIVLWSRQSGKNGGAHVELDSGFEGIRQLAKELNSNVGQREVLLVGDDREIPNMTETANDPVMTKLQRIAYDVPGTKAMGSFWKDQQFKEIWGGDPLMERVGQMLLWKDLADRKGGKVVHVGMRSGNLETFALLGMKTVYLEVANSPTGDRMLQFAKAGIPYTRFEIDQSPTKTGQQADILSRNSNQGITGKVIKGKIATLARERMGQRWDVLDEIHKKGKESIIKDWQAGGNAGIPKEELKSLAHITKKSALTAIPADGAQSTHQSTTLQLLTDRIVEASTEQFKAGLKPKGFTDQNLTDIKSLVEQQMSRTS